MDDSFCRFLFDCVEHVTTSRISYTFPLLGLYSFRAQNGYGPHRPCTIVLLTLVAPRGVTDLYLS